MKIKNVCLSDVPAWVSLSKEYDKHILEIVPDLTEWYHNDETALSFDSYMKAKINKKEAFMAANKENNCCGIVAISKKNNKITFFAISHKCDFIKAGEFLLAHALSKLNKNLQITTNIIKSDAEQIQKQYILFNRHGFAFSFDTLENGVPVSCFSK